MAGKNQAPIPEYIPPQSIEAEQSVLASMMIKPEAIGKAIEIVKASDFYRPVHGEIFDAMVSLYLRNVPVDMVTLSDDLRDKGRIEQVGGTEYLHSILSFLPSASRVKHYAKTVKEKSVMRWLIFAGMEISALANEELTSEEAQEKAAQIILNGPSAKDGRGFLDMEQALQEAFDSFRESENNGGRIAGPVTGMLSVDRMLSHGSFPVGVSFIASRPSMGKTSLLLRIMERSPVPLALFSLESPAKELAARMLTQRTGIDSYTLYGGKLDDDQKKRLRDVANILRKHQLYICDDSMTATELFAKAQRAALQYGVKGILVDYIQLVGFAGDRRNESRNNELDGIAQILQQIAKRLNIPIIAATQLSRKCEQREDKRPILSDLRDSGGLEANAEIVLSIYKTGETVVLDDVELTDVELTYLKQRNGRTGTVKVYWRGETLTFSDKREYEL